MMDLFFVTGFSFDPKLLTCAEIDNWQNICPEPPCGQLNVANPRAYEVLRDIYEDVIKMFRTKDLMFHVGGDEVSLPCWNSSSDIQEYLKDKDLAITDPKSFDLLWAEFHNKSRTILETATNSPVGGKAETALRKLLIWESTLTKDANLREKAAIAPDAYTIQLWSKASEGAIKEIVQAGYEVREPERGKRFQSADILLLSLSSSPAGDRVLLGCLLPGLRTRELRCRREQLV